MASRASKQKKKQEDKKKHLERLMRAKLRKMEMQAYRVNPLFWLKDRFGEDTKDFRWSELYPQDFKWDGSVDPLAIAWQTLGNSVKQIQEGNLPSYRYIGIESATGTSKTYWLARLILWYLDCFENSLVVITAPKRDQLRFGVWTEISPIYPKFKKLRPDSYLFKQRLSVDNKSVRDIDEDGDSVYAADSWHAIGFVAGAHSDEDSASKARGFHRKNMLIVLEEMTGIAMPVVNAFKNTCTGLSNFIVGLGNPNNETDTLHRFCMQSDVLHLRISANDYPNIVLGKELYPGAVTQASIDSRTKEYGKDSPMWNAMVRGLSPKQSEDSLIKLDWLEACVVDSVEMKYPGAAGIDVARSTGGDKAAVAYFADNSLYRVEEFRCPDASHLAYNLIYDEATIIEKGYNRYPLSSLSELGIGSEFVGVDVVGVGASTVETFANEGYNITSLQGGQWDEAIPRDSQGRLLYNFASLRAQMYWQLREDVRKCKVRFFITDNQLLEKLFRELTIPKFEFNNNRITVEAKPNIIKRLGYSPNCSDAVVYGNWMRHGFRQYSGSVLPMYGGG